MTVNPYLGDDSLEPFVTTAANRGAGLFVLVKTSNPGGGQFQDLRTPEQPLYGRVAAHVEQLAATMAGEQGYGCVGAVVGATYPAQLAELRAAMPHAWLLVPGYGSQGAKARDVAGAFDSSGLGAAVNNARGIIFAYRRGEYAERFAADQWQQAVSAATEQMIRELRADTPQRPGRVVVRGSAFVARAQPRGKRQVAGANLVRLEIERDFPRRRFSAVRGVYQVHLPAGTEIAADRAGGGLEPAGGASISRTTRIASSPSTMAATMGPPVIKLSSAG